MVLRAVLACPCSGRARRLLAGRTEMVELKKQFPTHRDVFTQQVYERGLIF